MCGSCKGWQMVFYNTPAATWVFGRTLPACVTIQDLNRRPAERCKYRYPCRWCTNVRKEMPEIVQIFDMYTLRTFSVCD